MAKLKEISFGSYKRFGDTETVEIRPVTILIGKNSSGKSSVTKLFPMLANSMAGISSTPIMYENMGASLGNVYSDLCHNHNSVGLNFGLKYDDGLKIKVELISPNNGKAIEINKLSLQNGEVFEPYSFNGKTATNARGFLTAIKEIKPDFEENSYSFEVDYIGPFRAIPERFFYPDYEALKERIGYNGKNAYDFLVFDDALREKVSQWFENVFDRSLKVKELTKGLFSTVLGVEGTLNEVNIIDEGQGTHQVLPIVVKALQKSEKGDIVVVEQPELHLHPAAHAALGELFASASKDFNHSFVVETHSENLLLGLRKAVVDKTIPFNPDDLIIYFVDYDEEEESAFLTPITINEKGVLSDWPEGVFNESFELLMDLKKLAAK